MVIWGGWVAAATVTGTTFRNNTGRDTAGAVFVRSSTLHLIDSTFEGNQADHIASTGSPDDGDTGLLSFDASALAHSNVRFTGTSIDGSLIAEATVATTLDAVALDALFAAFPELEDWI